MFSAGPPFRECIDRLGMMIAIEQCSQREVQRLQNIGKQQWRQQTIQDHQCCGTQLWTASLDEGRKGEKKGRV